MTDANVVLGHLPPRLLGGAMTLDVDAAHAAVARSPSASASGVPETAEAIVRSSTRTCSARCAWSPSSAACRPTPSRSSLRRRGRAARERAGGDPRLLPGDRAAGARRPLRARVPRLRRAQRVQPDVHPRGRRRATGRGRRARFARSARRRPRSWSARASRRPTARSRYVGRHALPPPGLRAADRDRRPARRRRSAGLGDAFAATHERLYGFGLPGGAELVTCAPWASGACRRSRRRRDRWGRPTRRRARTGTHPVWDGAAYRDVATYDRARLAPGMVVDGPAVVEQYDATTVVLQGHVAAVDEHANLLISPGAPHDGRRPHPGPHRERAAQRPLRDGRGRPSRRDVADDPRAARRVPDGLRPPRADGRRPVRLLHPGHRRAARRRHRRGRRHPLQRPVPERGLDHARNDWCVVMPIFADGRAHRLLVDVRPHDGRRRQGRRQPGQRRARRSGRRACGSRRSRSSRAAC